MKLPARIGVLGDVHAEDERLAEAFAHFDSLGIDTVLCVGDVVDGHGSASRCCELLASRGALTVRGNHDRWLLEGSMRTLPRATLPGDLTDDNRAWLAGLPATREFESAAGPLLLCHGLGSSDMAKVTPDDYGYALEVNDELHA